MPEHMPIVPTAAGPVTPPPGFVVAYTVIDATTEVPLVVYTCTTCFALTMYPPMHQRNAHPGEAPVTTT